MLNILVLVYLLVGGVSCAGAGVAAGVAAGLKSKFRYGIELLWPPSTNSRKLLKCFANVC